MDSNVLQMSIKSVFGHNIQEIDLNSSYTVIMNAVLKTARVMGTSTIANYIFKKILEDKQSLQDKYRHMLNLLLMGDHSVITETEASAIFSLLQNCNSCNKPVLYINKERIKVPDMFDTSNTDKYYAYFDGLWLTQDQWLTKNHMLPNRNLIDLLIADSPAKTLIQHSVDNGYIGSMFCLDQVLVESVKEDFWYAVDRSDWLELQGILNNKRNYSDLDFCDIYPLMIYLWEYAEGGKDV